MQNTAYKEVKIDRYEYGFLLQLLNAKRTYLIKQKQPTDEIDELIIKLIDAKEKKKLLQKNNYER